MLTVPVSRNHFNELEMLWVPELFCARSSHYLQMLNFLIAVLSHMSNKILIMRLLDLQDALFWYHEPGWNRMSWMEIWLAALSAALPADRRR